MGWLSQQPVSTITSILEAANENFYKFRERLPGTECRTVRYLAFLHTIKDAYNLEYTNQIKNPDHDLETVLKHQEEKVKRFAEKRKERLVRKRKSKKRDLVLRHMPDVELMRKQGMSYPAISEYLKRYKLNVHASYVQKLTKEYYVENQ